MKKKLLLLLVPFLLAFQCDEEEISGFETNYLLQNATTTDLFYLSENDNFIAVENQSRFSIGSSLNPVSSPITPADSELFSAIKLYVLTGTDYVLVYSQDPIDDAAWVLTEPETNRFEYRLTITDSDLE
ncbi:hypothetical protein [Flagellimonas sediminis]|uniref:Uncharacterized protein n=1 Tax=Flagellimonas sediminis TaxID=2696468 RepID=A0A6I5L511_9FLAO|nr:hypothetical protein [Allomuricauda sediminis]NDV43990.1 hypothetical protein [Allomuricauda sediminis]